MSANWTPTRTVDDDWPAGGARERRRRPAQGLLIRRHQPAGRPGPSILLRARRPGDGAAWSSPRLGAVGRPRGDRPRIHRRPARLACVVSTAAGTFGSFFSGTFGSRGHVRRRPRDSSGATCAAGKSQAIRRTSTSTRDISQRLAWANISYGAETFELMRSWTTTSPKRPAWNRGQGP